jgi:hypothetical protein
MNTSHNAIELRKPSLPEKFIQMLEALFKEVSSHEKLSCIVMALLKGMRVVALAMLEHALEARDGAYRGHGKRHCCPTCGGDCKRRAGLYPVSRMTLLGKVTYRRCQYVCSTCKHRYFPLDESLSLKPILRGHSEEFAKDIVLLCTIMPFDKGCTLLARFYGVLVSTHLARALTLAIGMKLYKSELQRAKELWDLREKQPELFEPLPDVLRRIRRHPRIYVMTDNSKLGFQEGKRGRGAPKRKMLKKLAQQAKRKAIQAAKRYKASSEEAPVMADEATFSEGEGWKDVRALLIYRENDVAQISKNRRVILHRRVIAHVGTHEEWLQLVHMALHEEGVYTAHEVVVVADGGKGIWEMVDELLPSTTFRKVTQILDWCHAASHLWAVGRALKGCKTNAQRKACVTWASPLLDMLFENNVANVIQRLRKLRPSSEHAQDEVRKCIDYFEEHQKRMRYAWFRKHNLTIGSGAIESIHAWVIQARCRLPGMRWSANGANALLRLRCAWASNHFDEKFDQAATAPPLTDENLKAAA